MIFAIDIGGTNTKIAIITLRGEALKLSKFKTKKFPSFNSFCYQLKFECIKMLEDIKLTIDDIKAIGVGAPNGNSANGYIENAPNLASWSKAPIVSELTKLFNKPTFLENDANIAAIGEKIWGKAKDYKNFVVITIGTGIGSGVYINNELYTSSFHIASEIGHITIHPNGRVCGCGGYGHIEAYASVTGIKQSIKEKLNYELSFREVVDKFNNGDEQIALIIKESANHLAQALANTSSILLPDAFILAGGGALLGEEFLKMVQGFYEDHVYPPYKNKSIIELSSISTKQGAILGAAGLALKMISKNS